MRYVRLSESRIEIAKVQYTKEQEALNAEYGYNLHTVWSDKPVNMDFTYLRVVLEAGKPIDYSICFGFTDTVDPQMECWGNSITVNLSEHTNELKKAIIKVLLDKFF